MRIKYVVAVVALAGCGHKAGGSAGGSGSGSGSGAIASGSGSGSGGAGAKLTAVLAWSWGEAPPVRQGGPRAIDPDEPPLTGPSAIAVGADRVAVGTQDGCLELLDLATGKAVAARHCVKGTWTAGMAAFNDTVIIAGPTMVTAYALADGAERWDVAIGHLETALPLARPAGVGNRFCVVTQPSSTPPTMRAQCFDPVSGRLAMDQALDDGARVAFGTDAIGVIEPGGPIREPLPDDATRPVMFYRPDGTALGEFELGGSWGPTFEQARPIFVVQGAKHGGWRTRFVAADGSELVAAETVAMLRGGARISGGVVTTEFLASAQHDAANAIAKDGHSLWRADLGGSGPFSPWIGELAGAVVIALGQRALTLEPATGKVMKTFDLATESAVAWRDRAVVLVEARETRSDSDFGDAGAYVIDAATGDVVLRDDVGRDIPGGQIASAPVVVGDTAVAIVGGRVRAYTLALR